MIAISTNNKDDFLFIKIATSIRIDPNKRNADQKRKKGLSKRRENRIKRIAKIYKSIQSKVIRFLGIDTALL